jgi:ABC-type transport system involved in cytochrome bd biosynthesis fused ATPase/permease subunit
MVKREYSESNFKKVKYLSLFICSSEVRKDFLRSKLILVYLSLNFKIEKSQLVAVVGEIGSAKSSLLSAMLGEMIKFSGNVNVYGKIAFVSQQAWIQNASIKDNIIFGGTFDEEYYEHCINACSLTEDLKLFEAKDETEIGEKVLIKSVYYLANIYS